MFGRICWLIIHWKSYTFLHMDEFAIYSIGLSSTLLTAICSFIVHSKNNDICYVINELCKLARINSNAKSTQRNFLGEYFVYGFAACFVPLPLAFIFLPFAITYDPSQLIFGINLPTKIFAAISYSLVMPYLIWIFYTFLALQVVFLEGLNVLLKNCWGRPKSNKTFYTCYANLKVVHILIQISNKTTNLFYTTTVFIGILLASCGIYASLKMYDKLEHIFTYLACPMISVICFVIAIMLTYLMDLSYKSMLQFQYFWKRNLKRRQEKQMLKTCVPIGILVGPLGVGTANLGLRICDDIVDNAVSLLIMGNI